MKYYISVFISLFLSSIVFAQDSEFGKVSVNSLKEERYEPDITAHASVLFKKEAHYYKMRHGMPYAMTMVHERIKFYDLLDLEFAKKTIFLARGEENESLERFSAQVYNLEDGEIKISKVDTKAIKKEMTRDLAVLSIDFPDVKAGSIIEYIYLKESPIFWFKEDIICQYTIPIKSLQISVEHINEVKFIPHIIGTYPLRTKTMVKDSTGTKNEPDVTIYYASNVPAINEEPYVDNLGNYASAIVFELDNIYLYNSKEQVAKSWFEVGKEIAKSRAYRKCFNRSGYYEEAIKTLVSKINKPKDKVNAIHKFLKDSILWNGELDKIPDNGCAKTYKERQGNSADLNLLLVSMLQHLELKAYPVLLSTTDNFKPIYPLPDFLNYVVTAVELDGAIHFIDASDKEAQIDLMSLRVYNDQGLLLNNQTENYFMVPMELKEQSKAVSIINMTVDREGTVSGNLMSQYTNYEASYFNYDYKKLGREEFIKAQEDFYHNINISNFKVNSNTDDFLEVTQNFDFTYTQEDNLTRIGGDELLVYPMGFLRERENPFFGEYRMSPIYFGYPKSKINNITFSIPEGYEINTMPKPLLLKLPSNTAFYRFQIDRVGNKVMIASRFEINQAKIDEDSYSSVKEFYQRMVDIQNEPILLKKIENEP